MSDALSEQLRERAVLYVLDELQPEERQRFLRELETSPALQTYVDELEQTLKLTAALENVSLPESWLESQRKLLADTLPPAEADYRTQLRKLGSSLLNILDILFVPRKPSLAVVTYVLLAFLAGSFWTPGRTNTPEPAALSVQDLLQSGALTGAEVSYQPSSPNPIHISLQTRQQREFTGTLEDPTVRELVAYLLLHDQNPGNRLQAVDLVSRMDPNPNTELTLISSALSDPNPGIRLQAVRLLQSYPVSPLLLNACQKILLADENEAVRMEAVKILEKQPSTRMIPLLQLASNRESNPFIQTQVENMLYELQQGPVDISARK